MKPASKVQENRRMLATVLGIEDEDAAERLSVNVLITYASDMASVRIGKQVQAVLERTVNAGVDFVPVIKPSVEVVVGRIEPQCGDASHVWVGSVPGGILVSTQPFSTVEGAEHAIFGLIAACYACGVALRLALAQGMPFAGHDRILVSPEELLGRDLPFLDMPCDLGVAVLAGAGAVGNGFLYGLKNFDVSGTLHVVDPKHVHDGILNRCIWFNELDIANLKSEAIVRRAQGAFPSLTLVSQPSTLKDFYIAEGAPALARLITTVDSRRARRSLQGEIPREVFDASTTGISEVVVHFNEQPSTFACLSCIYRQESGELAHEAHVAEALGVGVEDVRQGFISPEAAQKICQWAPDLIPEALVGKAYDTLFKARCAAGKLRTAEDRQVLAPFCNVSMLAGAFLALELVRRINTGSITDPFNYWRLSPWHAPVVALRDLRKRLPGCEFCGEVSNREVASQLWSPYSQNS